MARSPAPLVVPWHAGSVRVRHDDPALWPYSPRATVLLAAMTLVSTTDGLQRVLEATLVDEAPQGDEGCPHDR